MQPSRDSLTAPSDLRAFDFELLLGVTLSAMERFEKVREYGQNSAYDVNVCLLAAEVNWRAQKRVFAPEMIVSETEEADLEVEMRVASMLARAGYGYQVSLLPRPDLPGRLRRALTPRVRPDEAVREASVSVAARSPRRSIEGGDGTGEAK